MIVLWTHSLWVLTAYGNERLGPSNFKHFGHASAENDFFVLVTILAV